MEQTPCEEFFDILPDEVILRIFSCLDTPNELFQLQLVSKNFKRISDDNELWINMVCSANYLHYDSPAFWKEIFLLVEEAKNSARKTSKENRKLKKSLDSAEMELEFTRIDVDELQERLSLLTKQHKSSEESQRALSDTLEDLEKDLIQLKRKHNRAITEMQSQLEKKESIAISEKQRARILESRVEFLEEQEIIEKEKQKQLKKEISDLREMLDREYSISDKAKKQEKRNLRRIEVLEELNGEKDRQIKELTEKLERKTRENKLKRREMDMKIEELMKEMEETSERYRRHTFHTHRRQKEFKAEMDQEFERSKTLREENRYLVQRLEKSQKKLESEKVRMKKIAEKSNHLKALSFVVL